MLKLCGKFIENLRVFRKRMKNCTMPWSPLARAPWKRLGPLLTPWHGQKGEGMAACLCPPTEINKAFRADN